MKPTKEQFRKFLKGVLLAAVGAFAEHLLGPAQLVINALFG